MSQAHANSTPDATSPSTFAVGPDSASADQHQFVERRSSAGTQRQTRERRQFGSSHQGLSDDGRELAAAIDQYKVQHHRRYLTCDEMLHVIRELGYRKQTSEPS